MQFTPLNNLWSGHGCYQIFILNKQTCAQKSGLMTSRWKPVNPHNQENICSSHHCLSRWAKYLFKLYLHELKFIIFLLTRVQGCWKIKNCWAYSVIPLWILKHFFNNNSFSDSSNFISFYFCILNSYLICFFFRLIVQKFMTIKLD